MPNGSGEVGGWGEADAQGANPSSPLEASRDLGPRQGALRGGVEGGAGRRFGSLAPHIPWPNCRVTGRRMTAWGPRVILGDSSKWQGLVHSQSSVAIHPSPPAPRPNSGGFSRVPNPQILGSWGLSSRCLGLCLNHCGPRARPLGRIQGLMGD